MKPEELMVGDYIQNPLGLIGHVLGVNYFYSAKTDDFEGEHFVYMGFGTGSWQTFDVKDARPIPLTPEILEKNGFEKNKFVKSFSEYVLKKGESEIIVARGEIEEMWIRRTLAERAYCLPYPKYVHELQHALRLCGIEKEIEL